MVIMRSPFKSSVEKGWLPPRINVFGLITNYNRRKLELLQRDRYLALGEKPWISSRRQPQSFGRLDAPEQEGSVQAGVRRPADPINIVFILGFRFGYD
ncbi:MAG: hypothetical protein IJ164_07400 [Duodenibacillus sp.]|nr:hypothetical protein [Duodenibacillus sp.]